MVLIPTLRPFLSPRDNVPASAWFSSVTAKMREVCLQALSQSGVCLLLQLRPHTLPRSGVCSNEEPSHCLLPLVAHFVPLYERERRGWARVPGTPSPVLPACRQTRASPSPLTHISPWPPYSTQRKAPMRVDLVGNGKCFAWKQSSNRKTGALTGWGPRHHGETDMAGAWGGETHGRLLAGSGRQWLTRQSWPVPSLPPAWKQYLGGWVLCHGFTAWMVRLGL